jgi:hypothetical protein
VTGSRAGDLARARAALTLSEDDALVWFGVGLAVLERIEAGQIIPSLEVEQRIDRFLALRGASAAHAYSPDALRGGAPSAALPGRPLAQADGPTGEGACEIGPLATFGNDPCGCPIHSNRRQL